MQRENGFYWVMFFGEWLVANWRNNGWYMAEFGGKKTDAVFQRINETKLNPPE